ncbi:MAG TPA: TonB-dependent receptor [Myxococcales bacterium]|nr:TonB-dependent receptor [Myxococcales bacterium]
MRIERMLFRNALPGVFSFGLMLPLASVTWANEDIDVAVDIDEQNIEVIRVTDTTPPIPKTDASAFSTEIDLERYAGEQKRLEDLLGQALGVQIRRFGGAGSLAEVSIRGSTSTQVVVLLDGVKMNSGRGGSVDLSSIPLSQLEAVEVSRGGGAWGAGSGAMGGVAELYVN